MIPDPNSDTPLPRLDYTITSRNPDLRDHTIIAETAHQVLHPYSQVNSLGRKILEKTYPEYPEVPRLLVLTPEEAGEVGVPGFKINVETGAGVWFGTGDMRYAETDVREETSRSKRMEGGAGEGWWGSGWIDGWRSKSTSLSASNSKSKPVKGGWQEAGVTVLPGTTVRITTTTALRILVPDRREITSFEEGELIRADGCRGRCCRCSSTLRTIRRSQVGGA
jgi:hypothetical protein